MIEDTLARHYHADALPAGHPVREAIDQLRRLRAERDALRRLLADVTCGHSLYLDDGECSDASRFPSIDFLRDPPGQIRAALAQRKQSAPQSGDSRDLPVKPAMQEHGHLAGDKPAPSAEPTMPAPWVIRATYVNGTVYSVAVEGWPVLSAGSHEVAQQMAYALSRLPALEGKR